MKRGAVFNNRKKKLLFLAYDQGLEHGPTDFNDANVDPVYIIQLAKKGKVDGIIVQKGIAEQYQKEIRSSKINLIIKLNGKTNLVEGEPRSMQLCTVNEAKKLGARAVGYTIYIGSAYESEMMQEFEKIEREARKQGLGVILWSYPRGKAMSKKSPRELQAYAARVGLETGADLVKIHWEGNQSDLNWAVNCAGKCGVLVAGGSKKNEKDFLKDIMHAKAAGVAGCAIGRNIWQNPKPLELIKKIKKILKA